jgi:hypothetical protein
LPRSSVAPVGATIFADENEDDDEMTIQVRYLSEEEIERDSVMLLAEYKETAGMPVKLPIPVADITTYHLALQLGFADLHKTLGIPMLRDQPDILGAIWVDEEIILIDRSLDPKDNPSMQGRYRFHAEVPKSLIFAKEGRFSASVFSTCLPDWNRRRNRESCRPAR